MPRTAKKRKVAPRPILDNVIEFPRSRRSVGVVIPEGRDSDTIATLTVNSDTYQRFGLLRGDIALVDHALVPKMGDLCCVYDAELGWTGVRRYFEIEEGEEFRGVVWGFQRGIRE